MVRGRVLCRTRFYRALATRCQLLFRLLAGRASALTTRTPLTSKPTSSPSRRWSCGQLALKPYRKGAVVTASCPSGCGQASQAVALSAQRSTACPRRPWATLSAGASSTPIPAQNLTAAVLSLSMVDASRATSTAVPAALRGGGQFGRAGGAFLVSAQAQLTLRQSNRPQICQGSPKIFHIELVWTDGNGLDLPVAHRTIFAPAPPLGPSRRGNRQWDSGRNHCQYRDNSEPKVAESRVNPKGCAQDARNNLEKQGADGRPAKDFSQQTGTLLAARKTKAKGGPGDDGPRRVRAEPCLPPSSALCWSG